MNVLLIDDDDLFLYLTERTLQKAPCLDTINSCNSVEEARAYLDTCLSKGQPFPDAIFVDVNMPGMSGMEFADLYSREYASQKPDTKLVILTSSISRKEKVKAMEIPAVNDFLQKPLTTEKLTSLAS